MSRFQALSKMCLNNWHYINEKLLSFHKEINFFTGHSGSGKSTVLDALQIVLYADSNGRGFFNKAAKEDSDRSLIEYLRGMKVVQENNDISYLRNKNFSSTIVLEFQDTETLQYQSIGIIFDVDVAVNDISRMFFWHTGSLLNNHYREGEKVLSINELKDFMKEHFQKDEYYFSKTNEKFRNELYSNYFGGLHPKHFPALFKKAIPFKMDMKLEDFVKNYICTETDIHMEDMQDSVAQYTRLKRRLDETVSEIGSLTEIHKQYEKFRTSSEEVIQFQYNLDKLDIQTIETKLKKLQLQQLTYQEDMSLLHDSIDTLEEEIRKLQSDRDEVAFSIQNSGYEHLESELTSLNQMLELLNRNKAIYDKTAEELRIWLNKEFLEPFLRAGIEKFGEYQANEKEIEKIQREISKIKEETEQEKEELSSKINDLKRKIADISIQINALKNGQKAYPAYLLEAKEFLVRKLEDIYEVPIHVDILADVIEVTDETWLNAVEGYMGNNKLNLVVPPEYAKQAMEVYKELDSKKYNKVAVIDTEKVIKDVRPAMKNSLAEEVEAKEDYVRAYVDFLMGAVIKCTTTAELRENKSGITSNCILYQGYRMQHINPKSYTEYAYIGRSAIDRRLKMLLKDLDELQLQKRPFEEQLKNTLEILSYESLSHNVEYYEKQRKEINDISLKEEQKKELLKRIEELKERNIDEWKAKKLLLEQTIQSKSNQRNSSNVELMTKEKEVKESKETILLLNEELLDKCNHFMVDSVREEVWRAFLSERQNKKTDHIRMELMQLKQVSESKMNEEYDRLIKQREQYRDSYAYRGFSLTKKENEEYDHLLQSLSSDKLCEFMEKANEQAKLAIYHFKTDFIYKVRDAIKEVMQQKEDLNRILSQLDFGKDKYRFIITKNKGEDGKFYDMFMDENLEINPHQLTGNANNQMDIFSMQHEKDYSDLINELIELFMPPKNSDSKALEEARANMEKYADYRTYLSFDMEQLIDGMPPMRLSRMLSKNSGGEGQNPLYVALLASFAQVYRINMKANSRRRPTPRLVVLDEAFSKMDAEKVGSCIGLIRKLGIQAIIAATNDKIQNYVDNVDKTFVFANPNKSRISIQEFQKKEFKDLLVSEETAEIDSDDGNEI